MIEGKKILVSGATSGIGLHLSQLLLKNNYDVVAIGRRVDKLDELKLKYNSNQFQVLQYDLSDLTSYETIFEKSFQSKKFDGIVNCAGFEETLPISLYTPEKINSIFTLNVFAGIELLRFFSKKKYSNDEASVVFVSSVMAELGQAGKIGYCASKSAILGVIKSAALELAKRKIRVNGIAPGIVDTPLTQKLFSQIDETNKQRIIGMHPLGIGKVSDVVPLIMFLLSDDSKWITGQNIMIDGGYGIQ